MHVTVHHMGLVQCSASEQRYMGGISVPAGSSSAMLYIDVPEDCDLVAFLDTGWPEWLGCTSLHFA